MQHVNYNAFLKHELRQHMQSNQLSPSNPLIVDNERHSYLSDQGMAQYIAFFESAVGGDNQTLVGEYGLIERKTTNKFYLPVKAVMSR